MKVSSNAGMTITSAICQLAGNSCIHHPVLPLAVKAFYYEYRRASAAYAARISKTTKLHQDECYNTRRHKVMFAPKVKPAIPIRKR